MSDRIRMAAALALATGLLCSVAIANGFPLLFSDTGSYLRTGLELHYPDDRSPVYGLAIAPFARALGLWGVVLAQGLAAALLLAATLRTVRGRAHPRELAGTAAVLALASGLPWFTGQLMPDVATGFVPLLGHAILVDDRPRRRWLAAAALSGLIAAHLSHILLATALLAVAVAALAIARSRPVVIARRCAPVAAAILVAGLALSAMNLVARGRFTPSLATDQFTLARLFDGRLAQPALAPRCRTRRLLLCAEQPVVTDPASAQPGQDFLWSPRSPLWSLADAAPDRVRAEERLLIDDTVHARPAAVAALALRGWAEQLGKARTGRIGPYGPGTAPANRIARDLPGELPAMRAARQQQGTLPGLLPVDVPYWLAMAILAASPLLLWRTRRRPRLLGLGVAVLATVLANAAITGALSGPDDRYQSRALWLLPLWAVLAWLDLRSSPARGGGPPREARWWRGLRSRRQA